MTPITSFEKLISLASNNKDYKVLEIGTKRSIANRTTHKKEIFPFASEYILSDFEDGIDVDILSNAERLSETFEENHFDFIVSCSTFEHIKKMWLVPDEMWKILKPDGHVFVQTHHTFPLHAYPFDYWRFTKEAMQTLFDEPKWRTICCEYAYPCKVVSVENPDGQNYPAFLNVNILTQAVK